MKITEIARLNYLTPGYRQWFPIPIQKSQSWLYLICSITLSFTITDLSMAQSVGTLPPPPPIRVPKTPIPPASTEPIPSSIPVKRVSPSAKTASPIREYTFKSTQTPSSSSQVVPIGIEKSNLTPSSQTIPVSIQHTNPTPQAKGNPSLYRVQVNGQDSSILSQVKVIEPLAFVRQSEGVIHAGVFPQSQQAQKRVQELEQKGISATIVPVY
ncbi:MAG TPA: hypothetical protein DCF68_00195 [Cyanothece sp. UBA12306]|nr:hypothetical protein [Cyanothece sp. UBA12306]